MRLLKVVMQKKSYRYEIPMHLVNINWQRLFIL